MKHVKLTMVLIMVAALIGLSACSDQGTTGGQGKGTGMPSADDTPADKEKTSEVSGVLEQSDAGIMLVSDSGKYLVIGQDLTEMVGKTVTIKGAVEEGDGQTKIKVEAVTPAQ